jgi:hypothetical protein
MNPLSPQNRFKKPYHARLSAGTNGNNPGSLEAVAAIVAVERAKVKSARPRLVAVSILHLGSR